MTESVTADSPLSAAREPEPLSAEELAMVEEETALLVDIQRHMAEHVAGAAGEKDFDQELLALRDQLAETRAEDHAALVEHMTRLSALRSAYGRGRDLPADPQTPYFGHVRLREGDRVQDILVGRRAFIDSKAGVHVVDWRNSPVSRIFYRYEAGDEYEEEFAGRIRKGVVELRRAVTIVGGELVAVREGDRILQRIGDAWTHARADARRLAGGVGTAIRAPDALRATADHHLPEITALIDGQQFDAITGDRSGVVIIRGGAGTGKTTIALHRAAWLHFNNPNRFVARKMLVITPGEALARYVERVLPALDVRGVPIRTLPWWADQTARRLLKLRKRKLTDDTPTGARRLKRHPAMLKLLEKAVADECRSWDDAFEQAGGKPLLNAWVKRRNLPPVHRCDALRKWVEGPGREALGPRQARAQMVVAEALRELKDPFETWANTLTNRDALKQGFAGTDARDWEIEQLVDVVMQQSDDPSDYSHLDADRRQGIDGRGLDEGEIRGRLDTDDMVALLRLCQLKFGGLEGPRGRATRYEHIVVDEAQDLTPLALKVLISATRPGAPVTIAGDTAQKVTFDNGFDDWDTLVPALGVKARILPPLAVTYRSTARIMELARAVLGDLAPDLEMREAREGAPVEAMRFREMGEAVAFLGDALKSLHDRERAANVAVVARTPEIAQAYYDGLAQAEVPNLRRVRAQEFEFTPGVDVTDVMQIKGLEYDYVVMVEVNHRAYPKNVESRHLLHVGMTRAAHQLWILNSEAPSPLLPADLVD